MANTTENSDRYSPEKLLRGFSKTKFILFTIIAILLHVLVIGATSLNYIYYALNPAAAKALEEQKAAAIKAVEEKKSEGKATVAKATNEPAAVPGTQVSSTSAPSAGATSALTPSGVPADRTNAPLMKEITAVAKPDEIPAQPDDLGIKIEDTNPK